MNSTSFSPLQDLVRIKESSCLCKSFIHIDDDILFGSPLSYELDVNKFTWSFEGATQLTTLEEDAILFPKRAMLHSYIYRHVCSNPIFIEDKWYAITLRPDCPVSLEYLATELIYNEVCVDTSRKLWKTSQPFPAELQIYIPSSKQEEETRTSELRSKIEEMYTYPNKMIQHIQELHAELDEIIRCNRQNIDLDFIEYLEHFARLLYEAPNYIQPRPTSLPFAKHAFRGSVLMNFRMLESVIGGRYKNLSEICYSPANKTIISIYNRANEILKKYDNFLTD